MSVIAIKKNVEDEVLEDAYICVCENQWDDLEMMNPHLLVNDENVAKRITDAISTIREFHEAVVEAYEFHRKEEIKEFASQDIDKIKNLKVEMVG